MQPTLVREPRWTPPPEEEQILRLARSICAGGSGPMDRPCEYHMELARRQFGKGKKE